MTRKLRPGKGAKATILTRMIKPKQPIESKDHRSTITLVEQFTNEKGQKHYKFKYMYDNSDDEPMMNALARWIKVVQEGNPQEFFEGNIDPSNIDVFIEPEIPWKDSVSKRLLYKDIMNNLVPLYARDSENKSTMPLKDIYDMHPEEYHLYDYSKFSGRLSSLRKAIKAKTKRAADDQKAYDNFVVRLFYTPR